MEPYNKKFVPTALGSHNTGAICWLNSLMQSLLSCPSFTKQVLESQNDLEKTEVGMALYNVVSCAMYKHDRFAVTISNLQKKMVKSLLKFGVGQECATEGLVHLIDLISTEAISKLFTYRVRCYSFCESCKDLQKHGIDYGITLNLFHITHPITNDTEFIQNLKYHNSKTDIKCKCGYLLTRRYYLTMVPPILVIVFNKFNNGTGQYIPTSVSLNGTENRILEYTQVAQIEHHGTMHGGHYFAKCLRSDGVYLLNDSSVSPDKFSPTNNTYIVIYNFKKYN